LSATLEANAWRLSAPIGGIISDQHDPATVTA